MNDGHTRTSCYRHVVLLSPFIWLSVWIPYCYLTYNNLLPAPIVLLDTGVFIAPNSVELINKLGHGFTSILAEKGFDWKRLAGAEVIEIDGQPVLDYIDKIAKTVSGDFLDDNVRVNSVVGGYRIVGSEWSQRFGDHASEQFLKQTSLEMLLIPKGSASGTPEPVNVPFVAAFLGNDFADGSS
jgi:L-fucose mutarotase/ribose pyranase (RbsD/FucU family)